MEDLPFASGDVRSWGLSGFASARHIVIHLSAYKTSRGQGARPHKLRNPPRRRPGDRLKPFTATIPVLLVVLKRTPRWKSP